MTDKYELMCEIGRLCDDLERTKALCESLERQNREFKVSAGSGEPSDQMSKVYEYGRRSLFKQCFYFGWYDIGVVEVNGVPTQSKSFDEWLVDCSKPKDVPKEMSFSEVIEICEDLLRKKYEAEWQKELKDWEEAKKGEEADEDEG